MQENSGHKFLLTFNIAVIFYNCLKIKHEGIKMIAPASSASSSTIKAVLKEQYARVACVILFNLMTCFLLPFFQQWKN